MRIATDAGKNRQNHRLGMRGPLAQLVAVADEALAQKPMGASSEQTAEGSLLLCWLRDEHLRLFLGPRLRLDESLDLREGAVVEEELRAHGELQGFLERRICEISTFSVSEAARRLLQTEADAKAGALRDHGGSVALLTAERESRMALLRELDRLMEVKRTLEGELATYRAFGEAVPARLSELAARVAQMQELWGGPAPSRRLEVIDPGLLSVPLQNVYLHISAFVEANLGGSASICARARAKAGGQAVVELDLNKKRGAGGGYCIHFGMDDKYGQQVYAEVVRGPNATAATNCLSLACLFPGDDGSACLGAPLGRTYSWLDKLARGSDVAVASQLFPLLERRAQAQRYLSPQLDLLFKLQVHQISVGGTRLATQSRLTHFAELPHLPSSDRLFAARVELSGVAQSLVALLRVAPDYPLTHVAVRLDLGPSSSPFSASASSVSLPLLPDWTASKVVPSVALPLSHAADSVLSGLESSINAVRAPRDANFDVSTRLAKVLLAFDLYCFAVMGAEAARPTWNLARASCQGRDRRIECEELL